MVPRLKRHTGTQIYSWRNVSQHRYEILRNRSTLESAYIQPWRQSGKVGDQPWKTRYWGWKPLAKGRHNLIHGHCSLRDSSKGGNYNLFKTPGKNMVFKLRMSWSELRLNIFSWKRICSQKWESRVWVNRKESNVSERKFKNYFDEHLNSHFSKYYILVPLSGHVLDWLKSLNFCMMLQKT